MKLENFILEKKGSTFVLQINRPKALNALNRKVLEELSEILEELSSNKEIKVLIFTGAGEKAFIAGADISEMSGMNPEEALKFARAGQKVSLQLEKFKCPVIAAVNGFALGGGCEMALSCDFIIASTKAVFGQPEVCLGLITGFGGAVRLANYVGWPMARELIYTGRKVQADEALRIGIVNKVVESDRLIQEALVIAEEISKNSSNAVRVVKQTMFEVGNEYSVLGKLEIEAKAFSSVFASYDQKEGTKAFVEKRSPSFKGE